jgi:hypothetical protein
MTSSYSSTPGNGSFIKAQIIRDLAHHWPKKSKIYNVVRRPALYLIENRMNKRREVLRGLVSTAVGATPAAGIC